jgi:hypothetical protein
MTIPSCPPHQGDDEEKSSFSLLEAKEAISGMGNHGKVMEISGD